MLLKTKDMLDVLKQADVVDAGGKGLLCILEGAFNSINTNEEISLKETGEIKKPVITNIALDSRQRHKIRLLYRVFCTQEKCR